MKVCFRIDIKYVEKDTGLGLWFRIPGTHGAHLVWVPCCNADKHAYGERFEYIIQVDDNFPLTVKTPDGDKKMLPNEFLATYQIPYAKEEQEYIEEHKVVIKD